MGDYVPEPKDDGVPLSKYGACALTVAHKKITTLDVAWNDLRHDGGVILLKAVVANGTLSVSVVCGACAVLVASWLPPTLTPVPTPACSASSRCSSAHAP
jgi:hypothetical protein